MRHKLHLIFLVLIILIGAYLRFDGVLKNLFAFTYDVGRDMIAVSSIITAHKISLIGFTTGVEGVFYGPWWYILLLPFFAISGGNPQGIALFMASIGVLTVLLGYLLGKKIDGIFLGLCLASIISVSPSLISLSVQIWNPNITPLFVIFVLFCLQKIYTDKIVRIRYFFLTGLLLALISDLEIVFGFLLLISIALSLIFIARNKLSLKAISMFIFGALLIYSPRIIFEIRHEFLMTKSFISFLMTGEKTSQNLGIIETFANRATSLFDQFSFTVVSENNYLGLAILIFTIFVLIKYFKKTNNTLKSYVKTSLIVFFTFLIGLSFFKHDIWPHYLVGLPVFYILLFSMSITLLYKNTKNYLLAGSLVLIVLFINLNPASLINNFIKPVWTGDASVYKNQLQVIDYVYREAHGKDFKYVVYTPAVHDYPYRYLFMWYGKNKYKYLPDNKSTTAFFILEPDEQYPFRLENWLKERKDDGEIIKTKKFESRIIVQTRIVD